MSDDKVGELELATQKVSFRESKKLKQKEGKDELT